MKTYYAKLKIDHVKKNCRNVIISVKTFGDDSDAARLNIEMLVQNWNDIKSFEILKISNYPINVEKYIVKAGIKLNNGKAKGRPDGSLSQLLDTKEVEQSNQTTSGEVEVGLA